MDVDSLLTAADPARGGRLTDPAEADHLYQRIIQEAPSAAASGGPAPGRRRGTGRPRAGWSLPLAAAAAVIAVVAGSVWAGGLVGGARQPPRGPAAGSTVYVAYDLISHGGSVSRGVTVTPISAATNRAGKPVKVGDGPAPGPGKIAVTPDGKTIYVLNQAGSVIPINTATNRAGKPIPVGHSNAVAAGGPDFIAITPDGKTVYVANMALGTVTPINTATNTPGRPIHAGPRPSWIAITPDGKTVYVLNDGNTHGTVTPINTATNTPGPPIPVGPNPFEIAITPDGTTAYVVGTAPGTITPVNTATNTPGPPIRLASDCGPGGLIAITGPAMAITPDGKTLYLACESSAVIPVNTATNTPGPPIHIGGQPSEIAITPDSKTAYVTGLGSDTVTPINIAANTPGPPIRLASDCGRGGLFGVAGPFIAITPDGKTLYVACESSAVVPISTVTNTPGPPIRVGPGYPATIAIKP